MLYYIVLVQRIHILMYTYSLMYVEVSGGVTVTSATYKGEGAGLSTSAITRQEGLLCSR